MVVGLSSGLAGGGGAAGISGEGRGWAEVALGVARASRGSAGEVAVVEGGTGPGARMGDDEAAGSGGRHSGSPAMAE